MHGISYVTLFFAFGATLGCASTPPQAVTPAATSPQAAEGQSAIVVQKTVMPTRLPPPETPPNSENPIHFASQTEAVPPAPIAPLESNVATGGSPVAPSTAPPPTGGTPVATATLEELIGTAVANNPEIQAARLQARSLAERVPQVRALDDPMFMSTTFLEPIQTAAGPQEVILNISQKIPWFGKRGLRASVAYQDAQAALERVAAAELSVVEQVKLAYFELYFLDQAIEVNREMETQIKRVIEVARSKYETASQDTGLETVLQAQVELSQLQSTLVELEQAKVRASSRLAEAMSLAEGVVPYVQPSIGDGAAPRKADLLVAMIDQCRPELRALERQQGRDRAAIALARRNYYPDVNVGFNWYAIGSTGLSPVANGDDAYSLIAGLNLPIYRQKLHAGLREAQFNAERTARQYEATWDEVRAEVQSLHAQWVEQDRVARILDEDILPKSQQTFDLSIQAYSVDRITFPQLIENYNMLLRARIDYHRRLSRREQTFARLERAVGCAVATSPPDVFEQLPPLPPRNPADL